jgi:hypothetical protein
LCCPFRFWSTIYFIFSPARFTVIYNRFREKFLRRNGFDSVQYRVFEGRQRSRLLSPAIHRVAKIEHARAVHSEKHTIRQKKSVWASYCHYHVWNRQDHGVTPDEIDADEESDDIDAVVSDILTNSMCLSRDSYRYCPETYIFALDLLRTCGMTALDHIRRKKFPTLLVKVSWNLAKTRNVYQIWQIGITLSCARDRIRNNLWSAHDMLARAYHFDRFCCRRRPSIWACPLRRKWCKQVDIRVFRYNTNKAEISEHLRSSTSFKTCTVQIAILNN